MLHGVLTPILGRQEPWTLHRQIGMLEFRTRVKLKFPFQQHAWCHPSKPGHTQGSKVPSAHNPARCITLPPPPRGSNTGGQG